MINLKKFYKGKKVFITGATGFKGAWLCLWLNYLGAKVYGLGFNPNQNKNFFYKLNLHKKINISLFDIRDYKKLNKLIKKIKPKIVLHLAAQPLIYTSFKKPHLTFDVNFRGTLNLLDISKKINSIKSIIVVTSDKCYESSDSTKGFKETDILGGVDPYSASKSSTEIMVRAFRESFFTNKKVALSTGRAGNVIGGGDWSLKRLIPDCIRSLLKKQIIEIRNPNFNRPWQHVLEPLMGYLILAKKQYKAPKKYSGAWNFGTNKNTLTDVKTIVGYIINFWGKGSLKIKKKNFYEQTNLQLNISKAKKYLKWSPTYNIKKSVYVTIEWYKKILLYKKNPEEVTKNQIKKYMNDSKVS